MVRWGHYLRRCVSWLATAGGNLFLPLHCIYCGRELSEHHGDWPFCTECFARISPKTWHGCQRCGGQVVDDGLPHERCSLCKNAPLKFDAAVVLGGYHAGLRDVILRMKKPSHNALSIVMGQLLFQQRQELLKAYAPNMVIPIPMFWTRRLGRGMNNPDVLANCLAKPLQIPVRRDILVRCRNTLPQSELSPSRRFINMHGAFLVRRPEAAANARVLLVDDVLTTGATCSEAAKMLKQAGASTVVVAVVARAQGQST
jgi:ComF family protein